MATAFEALARLRATLPGDFPLPDAMPDRVRTMAAGSTPEQRYILHKWFGNSADRARMKPFAHDPGVPWSALIAAAFPPGALRDELEQREQYQNNKSRSASEWRAAMRKNAPR